jgi:hypothetical protein
VGLCQQVAVELDKALPALQEAEAALNVITKKDISELKVCARARGAGGGGGLAALPHRQAPGCCRLPAAGGSRLLQALRTAQPSVLPCVTWVPFPRRTPSPLGWWS